MGLCSAPARRASSTTARLLVKDKPAAVAVAAVVAVAAAVEAVAAVVAAAAAAVEVAAAAVRPADPAAGSTSTGMAPGRSNRTPSRGAGARNLPFRSARFAIHLATCRNGESTFSAIFAVATRPRSGRRFRGRYDLNRVSLAGTLSGLAIPAQRNLQLTPYLLGKASRMATSCRGSKETGDFGMDLKYSLTPSLTLDATYNTDFAQVEVDTQQINLDRFNLFFPEKRPFFLENAGLFSVGIGGEAEVFFSRAIGIGADDLAIPIIGGGRLSGRIARQHERRHHQHADRHRKCAGWRPTTSASRAFSRSFQTVRRSAPSSSTARRPAILPAIEITTAATRSMPVWGSDENGLLNGFVARTQTPGLSGDQHAFQIGATHNTEEWRLGAGYAEVGDNFNPEVGFLSRDNGFRKAEFSVNRNIRLQPGSFWKFHELRPHANSDAYWNFDGLLETGRVHLDQHWQFRAGHEFHTGMNLTREGVITPFEIYPASSFRPVPTKRRRPSWSPLRTRVRRSRRG